MHREFAGGLTGAPLLSSADPFDLVVIDEAHELFAGIYKRFDKAGEYRPDSKEAQIAGRVRDFLRPAGTPVLLLTATPIQNHLAELWGLVQYVEPNQQLLGDLPTFREVFCDGGDRALDQDRQSELQRRLATVQQRTLRRQAQEFLEIPFVDRQAKVIEYAMSDEERQIYEGVTAWLMDPYLCSFSSKNRRLLQIGFHRLMGSSLAALKASLEKVVARLETRLDQPPDDPAGEEGDWDDLERDLRTELEIDEDDERLLAKLQPADEVQPAAEQPPGDKPGDEPLLPACNRLRDELDRVRGFVRQIAAVPRDSKADVLLQTLRVIADRKRDGEGTGKAIIFTESVKTQDYLYEHLVRNGYQPGEITLFRGQNDGPRVREALACWERDHADASPAGGRPGTQVAVRLALVDEFRRRSKIFISTEAGAKGLNLQFCETLINYDLPWNPQRIEQRIGRVHRYRQRHGVTVFNFLDRGNEAQKLTFEILSQKLDLFGRVLDASDVVLHEAGTDCPEPLVSSLGVEFESELRRIHQQARSLDEVTEQLRTLRKNIEQRREQFDQQQERASSLISTRLDKSVKQVFARWQAELPRGLELLDRDLDRTLEAFLQAAGVPFQRTVAAGRVLFEVAPHDGLPEPFRRTGVRVVAGRSEDASSGESLYPNHPLIAAAVEHARRTSAERQTALLQTDGTPEIDKLVGSRGRIVVTKVAYQGFVPVDRLLFAAVLADAADPLDPSLAERLSELETVEPTAGDHAVPPELDPDILDDAIDDAVQTSETGLADREEDLFRRKLEQLERYQDDQALVLRRHRSQFAEKREDARRRQERAKTPSALSAARRAVDAAEQEIARIDARLQELAAGNDPNVKKWRERLFDRRYQKPRIERVLELDFEVVPSSCQPQESS